MAVTAIWDIKGRIDQAINYVVNPKKTMAETASLHAMEDVIKYASDASKTEQMRYVTGINCDSQNAIEEFRLTKMHWETTLFRSGGRCILQFVWHSYDGRHDTGACAVCE